MFCYTYYGEVQIHRGSHQEKFDELEEKCGFLEEIGKRREKEITKLKANLSAATLKLKQNLPDQWNSQVTVASFSI